MVIGITMIKVIFEHEKESYHALQKIEGIKEIYHLFGEFDFFVILDAENQSGLHSLLKKIHALWFVVDTWPLLVSKDKSLSEVEIASSQLGEMALV
ncbi:MAG TPA: Lrp/AsnC ligand binding domain-containing protein [Methanotrichaceae archaeon]|nr:Lrp/AsnC ligand binding domain-containing protein [Methanotrichaceae archaeon]